MPSEHSSSAPPDLARIAPQVDAFMAEWLAEAAVGPELKDTIGYALLSGGKRLRPVLAWLACEAVGAPGQASLPAGAAVEMVHAFSLVHDDLPAMDDDDLRRGQPTLHVRSGEAMAILVGDALLSMAFEVLCVDTAATEVTPLLCRELARGTRLMIDGQVLDTLGSMALTDAEPIEVVTTIHARKTGALIRASARMGAICGLHQTGRSTDGPELAAVTAYAEHIGVMFQAVDDLLDVESTPLETGKRTGKDSNAGKRTYPECLGVEGTRDLVASLREQAEAALEPFGERGQTLRQVAQWLSQRKA